MHEQLQQFFVGSDRGDTSVSHGLPESQQRVLHRVVGIESGIGDMASVDHLPCAAGQCAQAVGHQMFHGLGLVLGGPSVQDEGRQAGKLAVHRYLDSRQANGADVWQMM